MERSEFYELIVAQLRAIWGGNPGFPEVSDTENFFEVGIIDSIGVLDLLSYLEARFGKDIDLLEVDPNTFFTLSGLYEEFG